MNPGKALDIACGEGRNALWLAEQGWDVTAIDFSQVALLYMHTDAAERQKWLANTLAAVKSGGTFIYIGHDPSNIGAGRGGPQDPQYLPTAEELVSAMDGFSVQFAGVIERTVASDPGHAGETEGTPLDTLVRLLRD